MFCESNQMGEEFLVNQGVILLARFPISFKTPVIYRMQSIISCEGESFSHAHPIPTNSL